MKDIAYNVKNDAAILENASELSAWELFDKLGDMVSEEWCKLVSSPIMINRWHCKQSRDTRELYIYRKSGKSPTFKLSPRRGYTAVIFTF